MKRKKFILNAGALTFWTLITGKMSTALGSAIPKKFSRVRPSDPGWPSATEWDALQEGLKGRLIKLEAPFASCATNPTGEPCATVLSQIHNPYFLGDEPALTQSSGWAGAWRSQPSAYCVEAHESSDVAAAVKFARRKNLRLVVKGGGHSLQGTSCSADSLLIWTRKMNSVELTDSFVPKGAPPGTASLPAVHVQAGAIWRQAYNAVTTKGAKYVQGGGCTTVGVAGLIQSGGFGSFSKNYGLAAASLLEAEVVVGDGSILTVNAYRHPDLFWSLKGGGGGSLAAVTRLTLKTHELPEVFGAAFGTLKSSSDEVHRKLVDFVIGFYRDNLFNPHWGEQIRLHAGNRLQVSMLFQGSSLQDASDAWQPFKTWINERESDYTWVEPLTIVPIRPQQMWDSEFLEKNSPKSIGKDSTPGAPDENFYWAGDGGMSGLFWYAFHSAWLPQSLLQEENRKKLADALFASSRHWTLELHFNKGLAGAPPAAIKAAKETATNPAVLDAFALVIFAGGGKPAYPGMPGGEKEDPAAKLMASWIDASFNEMKPLISAPASYVSESDFFEPRWQEAFWGANYSRLKEIKKTYDPDGLFFVHHGVGSEEWSDDGFTRL
ncbi:MAG TPA: FAD-binding oxidoreductase [Puia sp.]|nr:FAD-binding oxidoreductase [Puia sp.]